MTQLLGTPIRLSKGMTDPRWPQEEGWIKMARNSEGVEIHYVAKIKNGIIEAIDDFKFIKKN